MDTTVSLALVPVLILLNAFFVASEYAVVALRPVHLDTLRKAGHRAAAGAMERLKADPAGTIGAIQVCITVTNLALGWIGEPAMTAVLTRGLGPLASAIPEAVFHPLSVGLSFLVVTLLTVVFSELLPKALTIRYVAPVATFTAAPVLAISWVVRPLVWLMNNMANLVTRPLGLGRVESMEDERVSLDELRLMATEAAKEGVLTGRERSLILNTLALNDRSVKRIMVPRTSIAYLDLKWDMEKNRSVLNAKLHTRLPLCDGGLDNIVGVVRTKQFLTAYHAAGDSAVLGLIADEPVFAPEHFTVGQVLAIFHEKKTEFVLLADEYGGVSGLVTMRDVIDDLMGVVDDSRAMLGEALRGDLTQRKAGAPRTVRGDLAVHELGRLIGRPEWGHEENAATVAGVIQARLGEIGKPGAEVEVDGVVLRVVKSDERRIRRVEVRPIAVPDDDGAPSVSR